MKFNIKQKAFSKGKYTGGFMKTNNIFFFYMNLVMLTILVLCGHKLYMWANPYLILNAIFPLWMIYCVPYLNKKNQKKKTFILVGFHLNFSTL